MELIGNWPLPRERRSWERCCLNSTSPVSPPLGVSAKKVLVIHRALSVESQDLSKSSWIHGFRDRVSFSHPQGTAHPSRKHEKHQAVLPSLDNSPKGTRPWNTLGWKGPSRIITSNSWPHTGAGMWWFKVPQLPLGSQNRLICSPTLRISFFSCPTRSSCES